MQFQWYPGHMTKAKRAMQEDIKLIDVIIELVDSRVPYSSKNPDIDQLANGKSRILLMNKYDLADPVRTDQWVQYYEQKGYFVAKVNSKNGKGVKAVHNVIQAACKEKISRGNFPRLTFSCPVPSGLPHRSHCVPMNMNRCGYRAFLGTPDWIQTSGL